MQIIFPYLALCGICFHSYILYLCMLEAKAPASLNRLASTMWAMTCDFQQCGILTSVDSDEPVQPPF